MPGKKGDISYTAAGRLLEEEKEMKSRRKAFVHAFLSLLDSRRPRGSRCSRVSGSTGIPRSPVRA